MAIIDEILRLEAAASVIKTKTADLSLKKSNGNTISSSENLTAQADAINSIAKRTAVTATLTYATNSASLSSGYYGSDSTVTVAKMATPSVSLSGVSQVILCKDKVMSENLTIPAANTYTTGSSVPSDATGNDGDIFLIV